MSAGSPFLAFVLNPKALTISHPVKLQDESVPIQLKNCRVAFIIVLSSGSPLPRANRVNGPKIPCQAKDRDFGNFTKTQGILFAQVVNSLNVKPIFHQKPRSQKWFRVAVEYWL